MFPDRYRNIGAPLDGGMGSVFPCNDVILDRNVAIKVVRDPAQQRRIRDELGALLKMRSKHVVQVYDVVSLEGDGFGIVQEFVAGQDLFDPSTYSTSVLDLYKQLWQIASGIADIHAAGVIHRDIKPNNMKLDSEGVIKIFDFGLARPEGAEAATRGFVGTRGFAAPELYVAKEDVAFSPAVDTYAFGATAYYLADKKLPDDLLQIPPRALGSDFFSMVEFELAPEIRDVLNRCLREDPAERPEMSEVQHLVSRHLLFNRHQALVVFQGSPSFLNATSRLVRARFPQVGEIEIYYDGLDFRVRAVSGSVFINYRQAEVGDVLPGSCVVALGSPELGARRKYITFDLSHPEIVL